MVRGSWRQEWSRLGATAVAGMVLLASCSGGDAEPEAAAPIDFADAVAADTATDVVAGQAPPDGSEEDSVEDASADEDELGELDPLSIAGQIINEYDLVLGDCFNRFEGLQAGRRLTITALVGCAEPHWAEVYHTFEFDAPYPSVYPGDDAVRGYARRICYENFEAFVGEKYELSVYEIGVFVPNRTNFEHELARYRGVHCWLHHIDEDQTSGSAQGTSI